MCGINGIIKFDKKIIEDKEIITMNEIISHRGPDDSGFLIENNVALGHVRLSILDLSENGHQPMCYKNVKLTFNGEIYNFKQIRKELEKDLYTFNSESDTEVVLKMYHRRGIDFINDLNGMFSMAILDKEKNKLFLIRDRLGIKPCYYFSDNNNFIFSSEQKAILECKHLDFNIDKESLLEYLTFLYIPNPNTMFKEVKQVKPGHYLQIDLQTGEIEEIKYWEVETGDYIKKDLSSIVDEIDDELNRAIKLRMVSDVPLAGLLSGGVDSSLICSIASKYIEPNSQLRTYSISHNGKGSYFDETEYALRVSSKYNTKHTVYEIDYEDVFSKLKDMIYHLDNPCADPSVFLNYYISDKVKEEVSVCLSGLGGDELFGGYSRYQALLFNENIKRIPKFARDMVVKILSNIKENRTTSVGNRIRKINKLLKSIDSSNGESYKKIISYADFKLKRTKPINKAGKDINNVLKFDIENYMVDDLLNLSDKMSMAHALELRVPFLDHKLVELAFKVKTKYKLNLKEQKIILKKLAEKYVDKDIIYRRKQGFTAPIEIYLKSLNFDVLKKDIIENKFIKKFIKKEYLINTLNAFYVENKDFSLQVYALIVLKNWFDIFGKYSNGMEAK